MIILLMLSLIIDLCSLVDIAIEKEVPILKIGPMPPAEFNGSAPVWTA